MTNLPTKPDPATGEPRPPAGPVVLGLSNDTGQRPSGNDTPPHGRGPALEVHGNAWWLAPASAAALCALTMVIFSLMGEGGSWAKDPFAWGLLAVLFVVTLLREWSVRLVAGADWLRVNRQWVDTYQLSRITLRGVWFGWMLRLRDADGRRVRTYITDLEANPKLWALVHNGLAHSVRSGAEVNNLAAGMLRLRPGLDSVRDQIRRPKIPDRTAWTFLLIIAAVFGAMYLFRPDLLGPSLMIFAAVVLVAMAVLGLLLYFARRRENAIDAQSPDGTSTQDA